MSPIGSPVYPPLSTTVSLQGAQEIKISIVTTTNANQEYSLALQANLKQLRIKARNNANIRIAFNSGDTDDDGPYWTINKGCCDNIDAISFTGKNLYIRTNIAMTEIEVMELY
ncbi:MAG: hypothetical protein ACP5N7_02005 [Candidatus Pacearchaeota archaeon]